MVNGTVIVFNNKCSILQEMILHGKGGEARSTRVSKNCLPLASQSPSSCMITLSQMAYTWKNKNLFYRSRSNFSTPAFS